MGAVMHAGENRAFKYALVSSAVLHVLALFGLPDPQWLRRAAAAPAPIIARLVELPPSPSPAAAPAMPQPEQRKPAPVAKARPRPAPKLEPRPAPRPEPAREAARAPAPVAPPAAIEEPAVDAPEAPVASALPANPAASARADAKPGPAASPDVPPGPEIDPKSLATFRLAMILAAERTKRYPRAAMDNNWEGRAYVRLTFTPEGRAASILIVRSSGHEVLDRQAIDTMTKAVLPVPPGLRGKSFALEIPISFELKSEG